MPFIGPAQFYSVAPQPQFSHSLFFFFFRSSDFWSEKDSTMANSETAGDAARPWQSYNTVYTNAKAGMEGVDKEKVQRVVYEMSKGSQYFKNEERKEAFIKEKIDNMRARCAKLTAADLAHYQKVADRRITELEAMRDLSRVWIHVDMDAFYAAVETLREPSLKGKPMAVGGMSMISTANYEARRFGVRAAMPGFIARKLCPELIFVPTDFKKYTHYSDLTRNVFRKYDPNFLAASLDEAYLDVTEVCKERDTTGEEIAKELRDGVYEETGLTCSAGVAPNRLLAKVCSDINKPNGQFILPSNRMAVMTFISSLPVRKIGGIGKVTEYILRDALGISTCEEILQKSSYICALFSHSTADFFLSVGLAIGRTDTPEARLRKSISNERTFSATGDETFLYHKLAEIAEMLSADLQKEGLCGRTLTFKLKTAAFEVRTRAVTSQKYICSTEDILKHASKLLKAELPVSIRLIGLRVSHFEEDKGASSDPTQKTLTDYLLSGDASRKTMGDQISLDSDSIDHRSMHVEESCLFKETHETYPCDHGDPLDGNDCSHVDDLKCTLSGTSEEKEKLDESTSNLSSDKMNSNDIRTEGNVQNGVSLLLRAGYSFLGNSEGSSKDRANSLTSTLEDCPISSSHQKDWLLWVDDYKCSICGIEMPPDFVEERQEHVDFHLAEKLQNEESGIDLRASRPRHRNVNKDQDSRRKKHKKHKSSPKETKYIPIDVFFVKSSQNF
uniref:DNA polymerase kappa isoform X2 n=1 Tax=Fragaria vesca subsp. vesca TaxID=101020 RepID=UPI0005CA28FA|nr:PREDICTED: DNA polymerase kappa isoform X2 [Fragaria vesca subsp. vesca]